MAWGLIVSIFCLGALLGCAGAATLANGLGRRKALLTTSALCAFGAVCEAASASFGCVLDCTASKGVVLMLLGRIAAGVASGVYVVRLTTEADGAAPASVRRSVVRVGR